MHLLVIFRSKGKTKRKRWLILIYLTNTTGAIGYYESNCSAWLTHLMGTHLMGTHSRGFRKFAHVFAIFLLWDFSLGRFHCWDLYFLLCIFRFMFFAFFRFITFALYFLLYFSRCLRKLETFKVLPNEFQVHTSQISFALWFHLSMKVNFYDEFKWYLSRVQIMFIF